MVILLHCMLQIGDDQQITGDDDGNTDNTVAREKRAVPFAKNPGSLNDTVLPSIWHIHSLLDSHTSKIQSQFQRRPKFSQLRPLFQWTPKEF